ncbi:MAG: RNA-guided endonuclease TnpB family protein [Gammaproteobacteria bacterium]
MKQVKTIHLKVKPESYHWLETAAREVSDFWNYQNNGYFESSVDIETKKAKWLSGFDLMYMTAGFTKFFKRIGADTLNSVSQELVKKRFQFKTPNIHNRVSNPKSPKHSLGWIPFVPNSIKIKGNAIRFAGKTFRVFDLQRLLEYGTKKSGCFSQNSLGEWFLNVTVELPEQVPVMTGKHIGIDLGLKTTVTCSDGQKFSTTEYRDTEEKLASAQRRGHKRLVKAIHAKVKNRRMDTLHKLSRKLVDENDLIVIGDVSSSKLAKTRMAKSVLDASWSMFKTMCQYKGSLAGHRVEIVNESYTTRACSNCGCLSGPSGLRQLVVRDWICSECMAEHDRDVNSAKNILSLGLRWQPLLAENESHASDARLERASAA